MSLVLIYAPMYPPMYIFMACYLVPSFFATRFGIAHWFAQPSKMDETVAESMRGWLAGSIGISLVIKRLMTAEDIYHRAAADVPLYLAVVAWAFYMVLIEVRCAATRRAYPTAAAPDRTRPPASPTRPTRPHAHTHLAIATGRRQDPLERRGP